jgi:hypothetical protein
MKNKFLSALYISLLLQLSACAPVAMIQDSSRSESSLSLLPNWYHEKVGYQLLGDNNYPSNNTLANLLKEADREFMNLNLQRSQIFLERAQRIASRDAGVYVRFSYLYWVLDKSDQAEQMALRALAVMTNNAQAKAEVQRLLMSIRNSRY